MKIEEIRNTIQEEIEVYTRIAKEHRVAWYQKKEAGLEDFDYRMSEEFKSDAFTLAHLMGKLGFIKKEQEDELVKLISRVVICDSDKEFMDSIRA